MNVDMYYFQQFHGLLLLFSFHLRVKTNAVSQLGFGKWFKMNEHMFCEFIVRWLNYFARSFEVHLKYLRWFCRWFSTFDIKFCWICLVFTSFTSYHNFKFENGFRLTGVGQFFGPSIDRFRKCNFRNLI